MFEMYSFVKDVQYRFEMYPFLKDVEYRFLKSLEIFMECLLIENILVCQFSELSDQI